MMDEQTAIGIQILSHNLQAVYDSSNTMMNDLAKLCDVLTLDAVSESNKEDITNLIIYCTMLKKALDHNIVEASSIINEICEKSKNEEEIEYIDLDQYISDD